MKKLIITSLFLIIPHIAYSSSIEDDLETTSNAMFGEQTRMDLKAIQHAFNDSKPKESSLIIPWVDAETVKVAVREFMSTSIFFPEKIKAFVLGDKTNFKWMPQKNKKWGYLTTQNRGADTNLLLVGESGNVYNLYVRSIGIDSEKLPTLIARYTNDSLLEYVMPATNIVAIKNNPELNGEYLRKLDAIKPEDINTAYSKISGNHDIMPKIIFDDGHFTYFKFGEKNLDKVRRLPTIYRVVDGYDNMVNLRVVGGTLIAEIVSDKWTLRHGSSHACIRAK